MNVQEITEVLEPITDRSSKPKRSLKKVAFRNGHGYACDGRIAMRIMLDDPNEEIPEEDDGCYPFLAIEDLMVEVDKQDKWYTLDAEALKDVTDRFDRFVRDRKFLSDSLYDSRYAEHLCPHCGKTVWYDSITESIVAERIDNTFDPKCEHFPGNMEIGDANAVVGFGYLRAAINVIGVEAQFALGDEREDGSRILFFRSCDGSIVGVFALIRVLDKDTYEPNWEIKCREVTND